jgi:hypothetical protein
MNKQFFEDLKAYLMKQPYGEVAMFVAGLTQLLTPPPAQPNVKPPVAKPAESAATQDAAIPAETAKEKAK